MAALTVSRPLNVLFVSLTDMLNGAERVMLDLIDGLDRQRFRPTVVVPAEGAVSRATQARNVATFIVPAPRWLPFAHDTAPPSYHWRRYWEDAASFVNPLASIIRGHHIDVVYSASGTILHGALAAIVCGRPHVHHLQEILGNPKLGLVMPRGEARTAYKVIGALASRVVYISQASRRDVGAAVARRKGRLVPLGFKPMPAATERMELPGPAGAHVRVGIIGGVWGPKGADVIVPIVRRVTEAMPQVYFYWLGPGDRAVMNGLAAASSAGNVPHLRFLGYHDDAWRFLKSIDLLLHPSHAECFPRVLVEAAQAERPVVATRCGGTDEIVEDGVTGLLAPVADVAALADAVCRLAADAPLAHTMGRAAAVRAQCFGFETFVSAMEELFLEAYTAGPIGPGVGRRLMSGLLQLPTLVAPAARALRTNGRSLGSERC